MFDRPLDKNQFSFTEFVLLKRLSIISVIISIIGLLINFVIGFSYELLLIPIISFVIYFFIYYNIKRTKNKSLFKIKSIFTSYTLIVLNFLWYYNYGSYGPAPYFFIFMFSVFLFLWQGKQLFVLSSVIAINIIILFILEFYIEGFISNYSSDESRIIDVYTSLFFYGAIIVLLIVYARQLIMKQFEKAKKSDQLKSSFLNNLSHEIRTPLNGIIGNSNMLISYRNIDEKTQKQFVSEISKSKDELLSNLDQILEVSKLISGDVEIKYKEVNIKNELNDLFNSYKQRCELQNLSFEFKFKNIRSIIKTDIRLIKKCIDNVFNNSLKFTKEGTIIISVSEISNKLYIKILDTGIGIEDEHFELIFNQFYKVEDFNKEVYRGLGLGLFQSKKIAELLQGDISIRSELNKFSEFLIKIPVK